MTRRTLIHDDPDFPSLLTIAAQASKLSEAIVEKDYWVTHTLWALHQTGLEVSFKGGTSLSKGFGLIARFSEDLDLRIDPGTKVLPAVSSWKSEGAKAKKERRDYFDGLKPLLVVPGATVAASPERDENERQATFEVRYVSKTGTQLPGAMKPFVALEVGDTNVDERVPRDMTSYVHEALTTSGRQDSYVDNRPKAVQCIHPAVTLLEKLEAIERRYGKRDPAGFIRHYEDAATIIRKGLQVADHPIDVPTLVKRMLETKQIRTLPGPDSEAFARTEGGHEEMEKAWKALDPVYFGPRTPLAECCAIIRAWIGKNLR